MVFVLNEYVFNRLPWRNETMGVPRNARYARSYQVSQKNWLYWKWQGKGLSNQSLYWCYDLDPFQSRVWPGQKMPGNVGGKYKWACGLRVWRINHDESVLYVSGTGVPGKTGDTLQVCDTRIPGHR